MLNDQRTCIGIFFQKLTGNTIPVVIEDTIVFNNSRGESKAGTVGHASAHFLVYSLYDPLSLKCGLILYQQRS